LAQAFSANRDMEGEQHETLELWPSGACSNLFQEKRQSEPIIGRSGQTEFEGTPCKGVLQQWRQQQQQQQQQHSWAREEDTVLGPIHTWELQNSLEHTSSQHQTTRASVSVTVAPVLPHKVQYQTRNCGDSLVAAEASHWRPSVHELASGTSSSSHSIPSSTLKVEDTDKTEANTLQLSTRFPVSNVSNEAQSWPIWSILPPKGSAMSELCHFCFQVLLAHLRSRSPPPFPASADPFFKAPLFVTWMVKRRNEQNGTWDLALRGCIGCLEPIGFCPGLSEYALRSSIQDARFPPVKLDEVPLLTCKLSTLYQFETCAHIYDWQIGVHGLLIKFTDMHGRQYSATYLPEVAREQGMSHALAIKELVTKSGYTGPLEQGILERIQVTRYRTLVESVAYNEFVERTSSYNSFHT